MTATTQRFINVEKASNDIQRVNKVFNISILNHLLIIFIVFVLAETVGLWFLNHKLVIPTERLQAANIVYQLALIIALVEIIKVPFNAMIVAHEKMGFYAWLGLGETILKLTSVFILSHITHYDKLITYGCLLLSVSLIVLSLYVLFTKYYFKEAAHFRLYKDLSKNQRNGEFFRLDAHGASCLCGFDPRLEYGIKLILWCGSQRSCCHCNTSRRCRL